jgi:hypothetical protein
MPGLTVAALTVCYLREWPSASPLHQVATGTAIGIAAWLLVSLSFLRGFAHVERADAAVYDELNVRLASLQARIGAIRGAHSGDAAFAEALEHTNRLVAALNPDSRYACSGRWLSGMGYINLWRHVHRAEEALLELEDAGSLHALAVTSRSRLETTPVEGRTTLLYELKPHLGNSSFFEGPQGHALVRQITFRLNCYTDEIYQGLVRLRNRMFQTLVHTSVVGAGILGIVMLVLRKDKGYDPKSVVAAALVFYLIGALVGLFGELYATSRRRRGAVHDYGLATVRVLTIPALSGIAAVGGVLITRLGGTLTSDAVRISAIFSLSSYPFGLVVAAIFGLTPGLLLQRLRAQTDEYKDRISKSESERDTKS